MIDDHDMCEWVNVSSGRILAHLGCTRQNPESHKAVEEVVVVR